MVIGMACIFGIPQNSTARIDTHNKVLCFTLNFRKHHHTDIIYH